MIPILTWGNTHQDANACLQALGLATGDTVIVHSSMKSMGRVDGGADTVVDALLKVLGPEGTLVVPTFTLSLVGEEHPVFDPENTPSEMGLITETVRKHPASRRSIHYYHSVAALGARADEITDADPSVCVLARGGPFRKLLDMDAKVLLLGVPYIFCTGVLLAEYEAGVSCRTVQQERVSVRQPDGSLRIEFHSSYKPTPRYPGSDYNRIGNAVEEQGLVAVGAIGNAVVRLFSLADLVKIGAEMGRSDPSVFRKTGEAFTPLLSGCMTDEPGQWKSVLDPDKYAQSPGQQ